MKVLLLGGNGILGPHVVKALEGEHQLRITDVVPMDSPHETRFVDVTDAHQVMAAADGMDVIVNCSVFRRDPRLAFEVNTLGTYNAVRAAVAHGMDRFINTGPHYAVLGDRYMMFDNPVREDIPVHPNFSPYPFSKALGHAVCQAFADSHPIHVLFMLFESFPSPQAEPGREGTGTSSFAVSFRDAAQAISRGLQVDLARLPSRCEVFFITGPIPQERFPTTKARFLLGFEPKDSLEDYWRKPAAPG
jgi:nucleoside-diphosphate-sugar epimerase